MAGIGGSSILGPTPSGTISLTVDPTTPRIVASWTAGENETVNLSGTPMDGQLLILVIINDVTLARVITLGTGFSGNGTIVGIASKKSTAMFVAVGGVFFEISRLVGVLS